MAEYVYNSHSRLQYFFWVFSLTALTLGIWGLVLNDQSNKHTKPSFVEYESSSSSITSEPSHIFPSFMSMFDLESPIERKLRPINSHSRGPKPNNNIEEQDYHDPAFISVTDMNTNNCASIKLFIKIFSIMSLIQAAINCILVLASWADMDRVSVACAFLFGAFFYILAVIGRALGVVWIYFDDSTCSTQNITFYKYSIQYIWACIVIISIQILITPWMLCYWGYCSDSISDAFNLLTGNKQRKIPGLPANVAGGVAFDI